MQSGQAHLIGPKTIKFHEKMYSTFLETLKLDKMPKSVRVEELRTMLLNKIMTVTPREVIYQPCLDGVLLKELPHRDKLADPKNMMEKPEIVEALMFGDCKDDVRLTFDGTDIRPQLICYLFNNMKILVQILLNAPTNISPKKTQNAFYQPTTSPNPPKTQQRYGISVVTTHTTSP